MSGLSLGVALGIGLRGGIAAEPHAPAGTRLLVAEDGAFLVAEDGAFLITEL